MQIRLAAFFAALIVVVMSAQTHAAALSASPEAGAFSGNMQFAKVRSSCESLSGNGGLGMPVVNGWKSVWYTLSASANSVFRGPGLLTLCGDLRAIGPINGTVGASCYAHSGEKGRGTLTGTSSISLADIAWPASVGNTVAFTGNADSNAKVVGVLQMQTGALDCLSKGSSKSSEPGATDAVVVGVFAIATV